MISDRFGHLDVWLRILNIKLAADEDEDDGGEEGLEGLGGLEGSSDALFEKEQSLGSKLSTPIGNTNISAIASRSSSPGSRKPAKAQAGFRRKGRNGKRNGQSGAQKQRAPLSELLGAIKVAPVTQSKEIKEISIGEKEKIETKTTKTKPKTNPKTKPKTKPKLQGKNHDKDENKRKDEGKSKSRGKVSARERSKRPRAKKLKATLAPFLRKVDPLLAAGKPDSQPEPELASGAPKVRKRRRLQLKIKLPESGKKTQKPDVGDSLTTSSTETDVDTEAETEVDVDPDEVAPEVVTKEANVGARKKSAKNSLER